MFPFNLGLFQHSPLSLNCLSSHHNIYLHNRDDSSKRMHLFKHILTIKIIFFVANFKNKEMETFNSNTQNQHDNGKLEIN